MIGICFAIHRHYDWVKARLKEVDEVFTAARCPKSDNPPKLDPEAPTAVFMVGSSRGGGIHTLLWVQRLFPNHFKNFIFISAKAVDAQSYGGAEQIAALKAALDTALSFYVNYCHTNGLKMTARLSLGTDRVDELVAGGRDSARVCELRSSQQARVPQRELATRLLHNQTALALQRR